MKDCRIFPDADALGRAVAQEFLRAAGAAVSSRGRCAVALAGGHTPERTYSLLASEFRERLPWERIHFFWGDERYVPPEDPRSNYRMACEILLNHVPAPATNIHRIPTDFPQPEDAAREYEMSLRKFFPDDGASFDVALLGLGAEGHTASLFPGSAALDEKIRWAVPVRVQAEPPLRVTLTLPVLRRARAIWFLVVGAKKRDIVAAMRRDSDAAIRSLPAAMVAEGENAVWFLDRAANG